MTGEEELRVDRAKAWDRLLGNGRHPTLEEIGDTLFYFGLDPFSDVAEYVCRRLLRRGHAERITPPRGNNGRRRKIDDSGLRWFYQRKLEEMQLEKHDGRSPFIAARAQVALERNVAEERIRKLRKKVATK